MKANVLDWSEAYPKDEYLTEELTFDALIDSVSDSFFDVFVNDPKGYEQFDYIFIHGVYFVIHKMKFEDERGRVTNLTKL